MIRESAIAFGAAQESVGRRTPGRYPTSGYPLGTAQQTDAEGNLRVRLDFGEDAEFNIRENPHFDYGYAVTSHSSHGATADRVLVHVDTGKCRAERRSAQGERRSPLRFTAGVCLRRARALRRADLYP